MEQLNKVSKQLEDAFNKLEETINNLVDAEKFVNDLTKISERFTDTLKELKSDDRLLKLSKQNNETTTNIRKNIASIDSNLKEIEIYRSVFEDNIISYNTKIEQFSKSFDEKAKIASDTEQTLLKVIKTLGENERKQTSSRRQLTEMATGIEFIKRFKEVEEEQININKKLDLIYKAITGEEFVKNKTTKTTLKKEESKNKNSYVLSNKNKTRLTNILKSKDLTADQLDTLGNYENVCYYKYFNIKNVDSELKISSDELANKEYNLGLVYISSKNALPNKFFNDINNIIKEQIKKNIKLINVVDNRNQNDNLRIDVILYQ